MLSAWFALLVAVCSHHHLPCCGDITPSSHHTNTQDKADCPPHPSNADDDDAANNDADNNAADNAADDAADNNADVNVDSNNLMQTAGDNADVTRRRRRTAA